MAHFLTRQSSRAEPTRPSLPVTATARSQQEPACMQARRRHAGQVDQQGREGGPAQDRVQEAGEEAAAHRLGRADPACAGAHPQVQDPG